MKHYLFSPWGLGGVTLAMDQISKHAMAKFLSENSALYFWRDFGFSLHFNEGIAFSIALPSWSYPILYLFSFGAVFWMVKHEKTWGKKHHLALALVVSGALGNMIDRIALSHVIDFIDFGAWPVFNLADVWIFIGTLALLWFGLMDHRANAVKI